MRDEKRKYGQGSYGQERKNEEIDLANMTYDQIDGTAQRMAETLAGKVSPNQMRNAFELISGGLKMLERGDLNGVKRELLLVKPKIAYMIKERKNLDMVDMYLSAIQSALKAHNKETYEKLRAFNEAVLGYFKFEYEKRGETR